MEIDLETNEELLNRDEPSEDIEDCVGAWEVELLDENVRDVCDVVGKEDCTGVVTTVVGACNGVWIFMYGCVCMDMYTLDWRVLRHDAF